jgi:predicted phage terminase large subunit-like protein
MTTMTISLNPTDVALALYREQLFSFAIRAFALLRPDIALHYGLHLRAICYHLELVERGEITRLIILMPPRHLKSVCASSVFPVWAMGRNPAARIICMSYGLGLAQRFSRDSRLIMQSEVCRAAFPELILDPMRISLDEIGTTRNGFRRATSFGGPITGQGGDIIIADDVSKAEEVAHESHRDKVFEWFNGTVMTRFDNPKTGAAVLVAQRLHEDDLPGRLIAAGGWHVLELPAIATEDQSIPVEDTVKWARKKGTVLLPAHMDMPQFEEKCREIGTRAFEAQYQQRPTSAGGNIIKPEWFGTVPTDLRRQDYEAVVQSWDPAFVPGEGNDYSVCMTLGLIGNHIDILDVHRRQYLQPDLLRAAENLQRDWTPSLIVVEADGAGQGVYAHLKKRHPDLVRYLKSGGKGKDHRMSLHSPTIERGEVRLQASAPFRELFLAECAAFPNGKYDDQVDSLSQALKALAMRLPQLRHCSRYKG